MKETTIAPDQEEAQRDIKDEPLDISSLPTASIVYEGQLIVGWFGYDFLEALKNSRCKRE